MPANDSDCSKSTRFVLGKGVYRLLNKIIVDLDDFSGSELEQIGANLSVGRTSSRLSRSWIQPESVTGQGVISQGVSTAGVSSPGTPASHNTNSSVSKSSKISTSTRPSNRASGVWGGTSTVISLRGINSVMSRFGKIDQWFILKTPAMAEGSFGQIFESLDKKTKKIVAVKVIPFGNVPQPQKQFFEKEMAIQAKFKHPNIVKLLDRITDLDVKSYYLVMDLCLGGDLFDLMEAKGMEPNMVSEPTLARYTYEMLAGIKYVHHHHFCHRDIKPENYMLRLKDFSSSLQLIDFGLACEFEVGVPLTLIVGTVPMMAPEVLHCSYSEKCDIWSIGVTIYILSTGMRPFDHVDNRELAQIIAAGPKVTEAFERHSHAWKVVQALGVQGILKKMLDTDVAQRPSASSLLKHEWLDKRDKPVGVGGPTCCSLQ